MPHINSVGSVCHGVAGGNAHIDNVAFSAGAVLGWKDDVTVAFANGSDDWLVSTYVVPTTVIARLAPVSSMNHGYAGGSHAAWWWGAPAGTPGGLFSTTGLRLPSAGLLAVGPDGAIGYKPNYLSSGPTRVREVTGADWMLTPNHAYNLQLLGGGRAIWIDAVAGLSVRGIPAPVTYPSPLFPYAFQIDGAWWIGYQTGAQGTLAHPFAATDLDHVLVAAGTAAWPAFRALSNNSFRFAWSSTEAEQAGHLTMVTVTVSGAPGGSVPELPASPTGSTPPLPESGPAAPRAKVHPRPSFHRQYPHVDAITDWRAQQTTRLLWDRVFDLEERLQASEKTAGDLVPISNSQDDYLATAAALAGEALSVAQRTARQVAAGGVDGSGGGANTMPNYSAMVQNTLTTKFVSPIVPAGQNEAGKGQLCRAAAWEIYQVDNRIRLFEKTYGAESNGRATDIILLASDGSPTGICSDALNGDGTWTILANWGPMPIGMPTSDSSRWIVPTATIAAESGPMTPI